MLFPLFASGVVRNGPNGILCGWGATDSWKKQKQKLSWHCPYNMLTHSTWGSNIPRLWPLLDLNFLEKVLTYFRILNNSGQRLLKFGSPSKEWNLAPYPWLFLPRKPKTKWIADHQVISPPPTPPTTSMSPPPPQPHPFRQLPLLDTGQWTPPPHCDSPWQKKGGVPLPPCLNPLGHNSANETEKLEGEIQDQIRRKTRSCQLSVSSPSCFLTAAALMQLSAAVFWYLYSFGCLFPANCSWFT